MPRRAALARGIGRETMRCPYCHSTNNKVIDSRPSREANAIRRRRECLHCQRRFTTYEQVEESMPLVVKKDGRREHFQRSKLYEGITKACKSDTRVHRCH